MLATAKNELHVALYLQIHTNACVRPYRASNGMWSAASAIYNSTETQHAISCPCILTNTSISDYPNPRRTLPSTEVFHTLYRSWQTPQYLVLTHALHHQRLLRLRHQSGDSPIKPPSLNYLYLRNQPAVSYITNSSSKTTETPRLDQSLLFLLPATPAKWKDSATNMASRRTW